MESRQIQTEGNDCMIYRTITLQPVGDMWVIVTLTQYKGSNCDSKEVNVEIEQFNTHVVAKGVYDEF
jgi:hypothetical protein